MPKELNIIHNVHLPNIMGLLASYVHSYLAIGQHYGQYEQSEFIALHTYIVSATHVIQLRKGLLQVSGY